MILTIGAYAFGFIPENLLTNFDRYFVHARPTRSDEWTKTFQKTVKRFGDQQIITGIAILGAGFANYAQLSVYDWHVVVYLAWTSSTVHLTSLTFIRRHLLESPSARLWRVVGMTILFVMLLVALVPTSRTAFQKVLLRSNTDCWQLQLPAHCFWTRTAMVNSLLYPHRQLITSQSILSYLYLGLVFSWKVLSIFQASYDFTDTWCREQPLLFFEARIRHLASQSIPERRVSVTPKPHQRGKWRMRTLMALYLPVFALTEVLASFFGSLLLILTGLSWATVQIVKGRNLLPASLENNWGFGQILPLLLLAL